MPAAESALPMQKPVSPITNNLDAFWMPFTANRQFKQRPRLLVRAERMHYWSHDGRQVLDGTSGLWCVNAGHARPEIAKAVHDQLMELDYAPAFQMGHPKAFELAARLTAIAPQNLDHVFFTNSGSESVDTALKIALAYHRVKGEGGRTRPIGRERGYHGVNFGGISVGGMVGNRKHFGALLAGVDHIRHTHDISRNAFSRGLPEHGAELADDLERLVALHDASTIAAVIVEPVAGSAGVLIPPKGYLQRLRQICDKHGILLIFDEVITGFGRLGTPFGSDYFDVVPDIMTAAKGLGSGMPVSAVVADRAMMDKWAPGSHGGTYGGNAVVTAAAAATFEVMRDEDLPANAARMGAILMDGLRDIQADHPVIGDVRGLGLMVATEFVHPNGSPNPDAVKHVVASAFADKTLLITCGTYDQAIRIVPPLIVTEEQIHHFLAVYRRAVATAP